MLSIQSRSLAPAGSQEVCHVPGCGALSQRSSRSGLSVLYCKRHIEFHRRHGSYWHRSITAVELRPYRNAAKKWLKAQQGDGRLQLVLQGLQTLLNAAGSPISAYDIRSESASTKANVALARMREVGVPPLRMLEVALAVAARVRDEGPDDREYLEVNIAKALHRRASGTHRTTSGLPIASKYPHSAGRVLRVLGHAVWDIAAIIADDLAVTQVIEMARPAVKVMDQQARQLRESEEAVACELLRVSSFGMGPQRLAQYKNQLRRQFGLKPAK